MAKYYVSAARGNDATGSGTALNPWKTISKAIGATPAITLSGSGDELYIEPGLYRERVILGLYPTAASPFAVIGDSDGAGFLAGGYSTPKTGLVDWRAWSSDTSAISSACLDASGQNHVSLRCMKLTGGSSTTASLVRLVDCVGWALQDLIGLPSAGSGTSVRIELTTGLSTNVLIERCDFAGTLTGSHNCINFIVPESTAEIDLASVIRNCRFIGGYAGIFIARNGGTGGFVARGLTVQSNTFISLSRAVSVYEGQSYTPSAPIGVYGNLFLLGGRGVSAGVAGQIVENGNVFNCTLPRTNVAVGADSSTSMAPTVDWGDGRLIGLPLRPFGEPVAGSPLGGFGNFGTVPSVDLMGRARPEGYASTNIAVGAMERHDTGAKNTTHQDAGSAACLVLVGPASLERPILVDAVATTIKIKVRWDGNHGDSHKPQAMILANPEIGVAAQILTPTSTGGVGATPNSYETLTFSAITPTAAGVVILRIVSRASAGNGAAYFDSITLN